MKRFMTNCLAIAAAVSLTTAPVIPAAFAESSTTDETSWHGEWYNHPAVTAQPNIGPDIEKYFNDPSREPKLSQREVTELLQERIKYVFVIFNENHSFDNEYGTFPGVNGLYSDGQKPRAARDTPGFNQTYTDNNGLTVFVQPFRIGLDQNSTVVDSVDHSHTGLATKINVVNDVAQMDKFAYDEYTRFATNATTTAQIAKGKQFARLVMSHIDCDTIPFFWQWASRFTIFDNIYATEDTPSSPNAIAMLAGQSGETQWVKHPSTTANSQATGTTGPLSGTINGVNYNGLTGTTQGPPIVNDPQPWYGSEFDSTATDRQPTSPKESYGATNIASNLTFASLPLTFQGRDVTKAMAQNLNPAFDLADIQQDIPYIQHLRTEPVNWRWYQEGYDLESTDTNGVVSHNGYVTHHNGAQYFGYIANTPRVRDSQRGLTDFFTDMANNSLPEGGVFYIRGGYANQMGSDNKGLLPVITNPSTTAGEIAAINAAKAGDDDHPGYSDRQLSEAMAARVINAIAANPKIWKQSAIIITYDESDGFYDHVPPRILSYGPDGLPLSRGIRVPLILISPYARMHAVSHVEGDHNAIIETINTIFGLPPLASLPDEAQAIEDGNTPYFNQFAPPGFEQKYLGPRDINSPVTDSLLSGFDPMRLLGITPPLPASFAMVPDGIVNTLPHYGRHGCQAIGITPEDIQQGIVNNIPAGFNPLPSTWPAAN
jgi:phospholipase C